MTHFQVEYKNIEIVAIKIKCTSQKTISQKKIK
jgi:hypothetical protein